MKQIKIILFILCFSLLVKGQPIRFQRTYGFSNHDYLKSKQTPDGGYILYGEKNFNGPTEDILIIKTDSAGTIKWAKTYGTSAIEEVWGLEIIKNGYLISAQTDISTGIRFLLLIDTVGNIIWVKTNIFAAYMVRTAYSGYVFTSPYPNTCLTKIDSSFNVIWRKKYNIPGATSTSSLCKTIDGGFLIGGNAYGYNGSLDFSLVKTDSMGNILWVKRYGGNSDEWFPWVESTFDGGSIIVGSTQSYGVGGQDIILMKLDATGNIQWTKTFGGSMTDGGYMVKPTFGSIGYIITGTTDGFSIPDDSAAWGNVRSFLIKTDINGNYQWARRYGIGPFDNASTVWETQDGGYMFSGSTASWGAGGYEGWIIKTDNLGNSGCYDYPTIPMITNPPIMDSSLTWTESNDTLTFGGPEILFDSVATPFLTIECLSGPNGLGIEEHTNLNEINIFPNPTSGKFEIESSQINIESLAIYNIFGERIYFLNKSPFQETTIDLSSQAEGIYFVRINTKSGMICKKIIIEK